MIMHKSRIKQRKYERRLSLDNAGHTFERYLSTSPNDESH